jgi:hypothetical protein
MDNREGRPATILSILLNIVFFALVIVGVIIWMSR